jgi:plasmid stabilization system protein ParE
MSLRYILAPQAAHDLAEIWRYIKEQTSLTIADRVVSAIREKIAFLVGTPTCRSQSEGFDRRRCQILSVYSYLIVYRPQTKPLQVAAILHGRRDGERCM